MKKIKYLLIFSFSLLLLNTKAQNIGIGTTTPDSSAILDVKSTTKGFLMPRMTKAQRDSITNPKAGLLVYQTDNTAGSYQYDGSSWKLMGSSSIIASNGLTKSGDSVKLGGTITENTTFNVANTSIKYNVDIPETVYNSQTNASTSFSLSQTSAGSGQSFRTATSYGISKVHFKVSELNTAYYYYLYSGDGMVSYIGTGNATSDANGDLYVNLNIAASANQTFTLYVKKAAGGTSYIYGANSNTYSNGTYYFNLSSSNSNADLYFEVFENSNSSVPLFINGSNGNVGIGTETPTDKLFVSGNITSNATINGSKLNVAGTGGATISTTNPGSGSTDWVAANLGGTAGKRVVIGNLFGEAVVGAHNSTLNAWDTLTLNSGGTVKIPSVAGTGTRMVVADANGNLAAQAIPTGNSGTVTNVSAASPISVTNGTSTPSISISQANTSTNGYLSSSDWNTFNNKQNSLSKASANDSGYLSSNDWNIFNNKQNSLSKASANDSGYLSSSDWNTFNNKQNTLPVASATTNGYLSSADWNTFNNKSEPISLYSANATTRGLLDSDDWVSFTNKQDKLNKASATDSGYLSSNDWNIFNNKQNGLTKASATDSGYLSSNDWNTFNNKGNFIAFDGLTKSNDSVKLGGTLNNNSEINLNSNNFTFRTTIPPSTYASQNLADVGYGVDETGIGLGQSFKTTTGFGIAQIVLKATANTTYIYSLYDGQGASGTLLSTNTVNSNANSSVIINLNQPASINQSFTIYLRRATPGTSHISLLSYDNYADGTYYYETSPQAGDLFFEITENTGNNTNLFIDGSNGNIGIGTTSPTQKLQVNGNVLLQSLAGSGTRYVTATSTGILSTSTLGNASSSTNGILTSTDWNTFNNKQDALSNASTSTNGILTSTDWNTFNNKQDALSNASTSTNGILTSTDWNVFNNKQNALSNASSSTNGILTSTDWNTFNNKQDALSNVSSSTNGILTSTDWNIFNNKQNALSNASSTISGILTSTDWNTFNNKFSLPSLTSGSVLFSNGSTLTQNNTKYFWDNTNNRLGIGTNTPTNTVEVSGTAGLKVSSTNNGGGNYTDWVAANFGGVAGDRLVMGVANGVATIAGHNDALNSWTTLNVGGLGAVKIESLSGTGTRYVTVGSTGNLSTADILNANTTTTGLLTNTDWNTFNNKFSLPSLTSGSLLFSNGSSIAQNNSKLFWDNSNNRLGVGTTTPSTTAEINGTGGIKISSTNNGTGTIDWVATNIGGTSGDRIVMGNLYGNASIGAHTNALNAWSDLVINNYSDAGATVTIGNNANVAPTNTNETSALNTKLVVNGSIRQGYYSKAISISAGTTTTITWNHNLGYNPIVMMSTDQNGGGSNMVDVHYTTYNNDTNNTVFVLKNTGSSAASGTFRWILVW